MAEKKFKATDKITVYYFGSANSTAYQGRCTTIKTFKTWWLNGDKKAQDIAFILEGVRPQAVQGYELDKYLESNNLQMLQPHHLM